MSTRCYIAKKIAENQYRYIYCHFDGYTAGDILEEHYQDEEKVDKLLDLGDISSLGKEVDIPEGVEHSFDNRHPDITTAYGRDRGEKDTQASICTTEELYNEGISLHHIYENGMWKSYRNHYRY